MYCGGRQMAEIKIHIQQSSHQFRSTTKGSVLHNYKDRRENLTQRFSSFTKLVRVIAYCRRWRSNSHNPFLKLDELRQAETALIRMIQREAFADDINLLNTNKPLAKTSSLIRLTPFLDSDQEGYSRVL